jgi:hypothetical protein
MSEETRKRAREAATDHLPEAHTGMRCSSICEEELIESAFVEPTYARQSVRRESRAELVSSLYIRNTIKALPERKEPNERCCRRTLLIIRLRVASMLCLVLFSDLEPEERIGDEAEPLDGCRQGEGEVDDCVRRRQEYNREEREETEARSQPTALERGVRRLTM